MHNVSNIKLCPRCGQTIRCIYEKDPDSESVDCVGFLDANGLNITDCSNLKCDWEIVYEELLPS